MKERKRKKLCVWGKQRKLSELKEIRKERRNECVGEMINTAGRNGREE